MTLTAQERYNRERRDSAEQRRGLVLDCAKELFLERGLARVTMNDILESTGVSRATLYRYFSNLDEIIFEIQKNMMGRLFYGSQPFSSPLEFLVGLIRGFPANREAFRFIGMFDNHYSETYPPGLGEEYESYVRQKDLGLGVEGEELPREYRDRILTVTNVVISFLQRLALRGKILETYQGISEEKQLSELTYMVKREFAF